ncbi:MAG: tRNA (adenosine(37)-N6)-threonylcarbamoyltransferase complex ATPase subunit type 1 TsaE [Phototrophicaceae bacterium]
MPILQPGQIDIISHSADQTYRLGQRLGRLLQAGDVVCLSGDMGAGKTVLAAGVGNGWGAMIPLTSPTFTLVHEHRRPQDDLRLYHLDCYRLRDSTDAETIAFDDLLDSGGVMLIEWPERVRDLLPTERLWLELRTVDETRRNLILNGFGARYAQRVERFRIEAFGVK